MTRPISRMHSGFIASGSLDPRSERDDPARRERRFRKHREEPAVPGWAAVHFPGAHCAGSRVGSSRSRVRRFRLTLHGRQAVYVEPLAEALKAAGISVWFDKTTLEWGRRLTKRHSTAAHGEALPRAPPSLRLRSEPCCARLRTNLGLLGNTWTSRWLRPAVAGELAVPAPERTGHPFARICSRPHPARPCLLLTASPATASTSRLRYLSAWMPK